MTAIATPEDSASCTAGWSSNVRTESQQFLLVMGPHNHLRTRHAAINLNDDQGDGARISLAQSLDYSSGKISSDKLTEECDPIVSHCERTN